MRSHIASHRQALPEDLLKSLAAARQSRGWSQRELGVQAGLPQAHISAIENGKVVPRFDTLLDLVRVLDFDLLLVPRPLVPVVQALVRDHDQPDRCNGDDGERPLYAVTESEGGDES